MARKEKSFLAKVRKEKMVMKCPVCSKPFTPIIFIKSVQSEISGAWKFNERIIKLCKCNEKEVFG